MSETRTEWIFEEDRDRILDGDGRIVATVDDPEDEFTEIERKLNGYLAAAAPPLAHACRIALGVLTESKSSDRAMAIQLIRAALRRLQTPEPWTQNHPASPAGNEAVPTITTRNGTFTVGEVTVPVTDIRITVQPAPDPYIKQLVLEGIAKANATPRGPTRLFQPTVARIRDGQVFLMNRQEDGWHSFAYPYPSLAALVAEWSVRIAGLGNDQHGLFVRVEPVPATRWRPRSCRS